MHGILKLWYYQCVHHKQNSQLSVPHVDPEFLGGFALWLGGASHFCLFVSQVITIPQQQSEKVTCTGIKHGPAFNDTPSHSSEEAPAFTETAKAQVVEIEPATHSPETVFAPQNPEALHETVQEGKPIPKPGDSSSFSTAGETDVSSVTPEKELAENSATGSSMQSGSELLLKGRERLTVEKQLCSDGEFSATLTDRGNPVAESNPESDQGLPLHEEKACAQTESSLFYSPSSPMSSDDESEVEDEDLKVELQKLREK